ncbi:MAG TPA: L,D-transpeptidase [Solirubrobacterales bacterium]|nr:L,D-transpeptidase [Solirubrobacterales bacterium]
MSRRLSSLLAAAALLTVPATAGAAPKQTAPPAPLPQATVKIDVSGLHGGRADIYDTVPVTGTLSPYLPGQRVEVTFYLDGHRLVSHKVAVAKGPGQTGTFSSSVVVKEDGKYAVSAKHRATAVLGGDSTVRKSWKVSFPALHPGECGKVVKGFKKALAKMGYVSGGGSCFNGRLGREVLAYRKVNDMNRSEKAGAGLVQDVFGGRGGYHVRYPDAGEHAEVPLSKQVLVLIKKGKPFAIYPVSTGKPSTPTITGHYYFYRQEPGLNSHGMYYSFYWHNGYAVHGYAEVPNYAASHGCVRTFIADQPRIYEQLHYGESIFVF